MDSQGNLTMIMQFIQGKIDEEELRTQWQDQHEKKNKFRQLTNSSIATQLNQQNDSPLV